MADDRTSAMAYKIAALITVTANGVANIQKTCKF